jgi:hypothetical protein
MTLFEKLDELRQKPEHVRRRILILSVGAVMSIVIIAWLNFLNFNLLTGRKEDSAPDETPKPWEVLKEIFKSGREEIRGVIPKEIYQREE